MIIGIGSKNKAKVQACKDAVAAVIACFNSRKAADVTYITRETKTTIPDMPLTQEETQNGALQRALFIYKELAANNTAPDFALGVEGGVFKKKSGGELYLQNWVYAYNGSTGHYGCSAALPLPAVITKALFEEGRELAEVIDNLSGLNDVRSNAGAFGILTKNLITRSDSFKLAVISALTPFFNTDYYEQEIK